MKENPYFPHYVNERNDPKILKLRRIMGSSGYGIYWMLLESLRSAKNYKLPISCIEELSYEYHEPKEIIASVINDFNLFEIDDKDHFFYSIFLNEKMKPLESRRKALSEAGKKGRAKQLQLAIGEESVTTPGPPPGHPRAVKERKGKKRKEKEREEDQYINKKYFPDHEDLNKAFLEYLKLRVEYNYTMSDRAINALINKLRKLSDNKPSVAIELIDNAILSKWKSFYPINN